MGANDHVERKKKSNGKSGSVGEGYDAPFRGYINLNLSDEQKAAHDTWAASGALGVQFDAFVEDGINLSIKLDVRSGGFMASATQRREGSPNAGLVVTARAREPGLSLSRLIYSLVILSHKERWEDTQPLANPDRW